MTGGASGIGLAMAQALASRGCEVVLADRQIDLAQAAAAAITTSGGRASAAEVDVTDFAAIEGLVHETRDRTGRLDFMVNNAGVGISGPLERQSAEDCDLIIDVNLRGVASGVQAAYPVMVDQGFGHIVNTASINGLLPAPGGVSYAATKHAVVGLTTSLRAEAATHGVRASVLCPGLVRMPILEHGGPFGRHVGDMTADQERELQDKRKPISAEEFARKALEGIAKNDAVIVIPSGYKIAWRLTRLSTGLGESMVRRDYENTVKATQT